MYDRDDAPSCGHGGRPHHAAPWQHAFKHVFGRGMHPGGFGGPGGARARRGDVRQAVLRLLAEQPMHGYQIIQELSARSGGAWSPSAGSVYPTLQMLADEGLVTSEESAGKKVFSLTEAGTAAVAECGDQAAPWEEVAQGESGRGGFRESAARLMHAAVQVGQSGTPEQIAEAVAILDEARKKMYAILAEG